jgi:hypothetical protein
MLQFYITNVNQYSHIAVITYSKGTLLLQLFILSVLCTQTSLTVYHPTWSLPAQTYDVSHFMAYSILLGCVVIHICWIPIYFGKMVSLYNQSNPHTTHCCTWPQATSIQSTHNSLLYLTTSHINPIHTQLTSSPQSTFYDYFNLKTKTRVSDVQICHRPTIHTFK